MKKSDPQHWESKNDRLIPKLEDMLQKGDLKKGNTPYVLTGLYHDQAIIEFIKGNQDGYYQNLKKAVDTFECLIDAFRKNSEEIRGGFLSHVFYLPLTCAVLLNDDKKLVSFCEKYSVVLQLDREQFFTDFVNAFYSLATGDSAAALNYGRKAKGEAVDGCHDLVNLLICVAENNQCALDAVWDAALLEFDQYIQSESQSMPEAALFMDGLALLKLNKIRNEVTFNPTNNDSRVPMSIL